ncbi:hypothetical protein [Methanoregula sp. PtaB.Bin085]|uniref:hypothetical protein n=1 Tax=Methanoregula sp. PtaB.Bin085 TaxID=1811680 RepID=UPI0025DE08C4|nr:hypothetical protein [Methanoregula sp. PtaB.Bin085]
MLRNFPNYEVWCVFALFITALVGLVLARDPGPAVAVVEGSVPAPESPSLIIPAFVIASMAGAVLVIKRIGES